MSSTNPCDTLQSQVAGNKAYCEGYMGGLLGATAATAKCADSPDNANRVAAGKWAKNMCTTMEKCTASSSS